MAIATSTALAITAIAATVASAGMAMYSQKQAAEAQEDAAVYNNKLADAEARNRELEAAEQDKRARIEKRRHMSEIRQKLALSGTSTTSGAPLAILGESSTNFNVGLADAYRASNMEAAAFRSQGQMGLWEAGQASRAANIQSVATGIGAVGSIASSAYGYNQQGALTTRTKRTA